MEPSVEQLDLIKSCIVQSVYYNQKKHKIGDIANLVYAKAHLFLNSVSNEKTLKKYILKVTNEVLEKYAVETNIQDIVEKQDVFVDELSFDEITETPSIEQTLSDEADEMKEAVEAALKAEMSQTSVVELEIPKIQNVEEESIPLESLEVEESIIPNIPDIPDIPDVITGIALEDLIPKEPQEALYTDLEDPITGVKAKKISKELTEKIIDIVIGAQKEEPEKQYAKIFYSKYVKKMKQSEIARELGISEEELSSRYLRLVRVVKRQIS